ncbi:Threonine dehydratase biosynthetic protein [Thalictrum thalictroides]|uniref:Threonine dehydratase biosynthetic protein n=1 Tax=Thalictrum thalictroides TaxID=46969 RepID=A0A7J6XGR8_THATH|nr:Threonine dehydratase biosynthetic protein [Thalictrum thalictroides]
MKKKTNLSTIKTNSSTIKETVLVISPPSLALSLPSPMKKISTDLLQYQSGYLGVVPDKLSDFNETSNGDCLSLASYLTNILTSKVYDVAIESPLQYANKLSDRLGINI